jgi:hypothetical protein
LPEGIQTTPDHKYEQGVLEAIRNPNATPQQPKAKKTSKKTAGLNPLFED